MKKTTLMINVETQESEALHQIIRSYFGKTSDLLFHELANLGIKGRIVVADNCSEDERDDDWVKGSDSAW